MSDSSQANTSPWKTVEDRDYDMHVIPNILIAANGSDAEELDDEDEVFLQPALKRHRVEIDASSCITEAPAALKKKRQKFFWVELSSNADKALLTECKERFAFKYKEHTSDIQEKTVYR